MKMKKLLLKGKDIFITKKANNKIKYYDIPNNYYIQNINILNALIERKIMNINSLGFNINLISSKFEDISFSNNFLKEINKMNVKLENKLNYLTHES